MKKNQLLSLTCSLILAISVLSCANGNSSNSNNGNKKGNGTIGISFNLANAKALAGQETGSRSARALSESSTLVKILENGSVQSAIKVPEDMNLSPVNAVFQSPVGSDIFILFSENTWYNHEDENGKWVNEGFSQLICVHEDGSYDDVLGFDPEGRNWKNIWANGSDYASCLKFDSKGNLYYMCYESSGNNGSSVFYKYNPTTKENKQLTAAVSRYSYRSFTVSKDGSYIFVEGWVNGNNNSEQFLRAIPVNDPDNPRNIIYGSWNFSWVYDDYTNVLYLCENTNDKNGGISKLTADSNFATKQWVAQNKEYTYIFTLDDGTTLTMTQSELYPGDGQDHWPNNCSNWETENSVYYDYQDLTATEGGIWGSKREWVGNKEVYHVYKVLDANRTYCGVQYELPAGYGIKSFIPTSSDLFVLADIMEGTSKTGYHTMFKIPSTGGEYTNIFTNVPNNATTELISWSVSSDATTVFFSGVRGLTITNGKIKTADDSYSTISSGTKFTCITALY